MNESRHTDEGVTFDTVMETARKEVEEELGISIDPSDLEPLGKSFVLQVCCRCVAHVLHVCWRCVARVLQVCCKY